MHIVDPTHFFGRLDGRNLEVHHDGLLAASHKDAFERLISPSVDLLVRNVGRDIDEVAGAGFSGELEMIAPTHSSAALDDVDDALEVAVMMRPGLGVGMDGDRARPEFRGPSSRVSDGSSAIHAGRLRRVRIEFTRVNDANSVMLPIRFQRVVGHIGFSLMNLGFIRVNPSSQCHPRSIEEPKVK
jgi:hypothetical protein